VRVLPYRDYEQSGDIFLPISYKNVRAYHPLPTRLFSTYDPVRKTLHRGEIETFDLTLFDEQGKVLAEIEGFSARRVADPAKR